MRSGYLHWILIAYLGLLQPLHGQIKLGEWRTHLPYTYSTLVEAAGDRVYCSATGGLFYYNLEDHSIEKLSKIDGLSDNGVTAMRWNNVLNTFVIAYKNANLDIIREGEILNIPDIMKKQIPGDKSINHFYYLDGLVYISTGFGIVLLDLERNEIRETYYIGDNGAALGVNQVTSDGTYLYAATDNGIRRGLLSDPFLFDFNAWEKLTDIPNHEGTFSNAEHFKGVIFASYKDPAGQQDAVYYHSGGSWNPYPYFTGMKCQQIIDQGDFLTIVDDSGVHVINDGLRVVQQLSTGNPRSASMDGSGSLWVADYGGGLITNQGGSKWSIVPNGPYTSNVYDMASAGEILYVVQGGITGSWNNLFLSATLESFRNQKWDYRSNWSYKDLITLSVHPSDPTHVFAGSWGYGLLEYREGEDLIRYDESNSTLQSIFPGGDFIRIGGITHDAMGNLWMTNSGVSEPVSVLKADGSWKSFRVDNLLSDYAALGEILVTQSGHKWIIVPRGKGLFAMDDNGTIDNTSDDVYKKISVVDEFGKVISNDVRCFAEDRNGNLWLGTNVGVLVIYSPYRLFTEGSVYAQEILVPREGEVNPDGTIPSDILLGEQVVTAIEVDGANRKWLGTRDGGVYLVSPDGTEQVRQFNAGNSPLLSDNIIDVCVDGVTGEVFFGTDQGIISYKGEAISGSERYERVIVYPNPVRDTYQGSVAIKGLVEKTTVKITDMSGNLVHETESLGGQALWDGKNFRGNRVATGVYMIYLSNSDGTLSHVTKLLFIH